MTQLMEDEVPTCPPSMCSFALPGHTCLAFAHALSSSFAFVHPHLGLFVLVQLLFMLICTCPAFRLCLYQIYGQYKNDEQTHLYILDYQPV